MTVDITQDEMNILNLNGISADEVKSNVEFMRASGYDDKTIRQSYDNTLNELRPITKVSVNDTQRINEYNKKGAITPYEFAQRKAVEYNGTYDNISKQKLTPRDISIRERIERDRQKKLERNKRVNEGTGSFFDRAGAFMDRMGDSAYQSEKQRAELNEHRQQPNKDNPNYRYEVSGVNRAGQPIYTEIDKTKKIGFNEALKESILTGGFVPYVGGFLEKGDEAKERDIRERILEGKEIRQDELDFLNYRLDRKQEELLRGYTIGGQIANGFLPSVFRLGAEMATGGWVLKGLGLAPELAEGAALGEKVAHGIKTMVGSGTVGALLPTSWNDTYATYQDMRSDKELIPTETGNWIFKEAEEKPATSFLKSLAQTFSMFAAEGSGELIGLGLNGVSGAASKYVGSPIGAYLMRNAKLNKLYNTVVPAMAKAYEKMNGLPVVGKNTDWLKKAVKYDGLLEEMGEEALEDVLNLTLGATDDKRTLENYAKAVFKSPDEWAVIAGAVMLQGCVLSATSHILGSQLERSGMSDEQIVETLNNLTPEEQREEVEKMIEEGIITLPEYSNENLQKIDKLKENYYNNFKDANVDDDTALVTADVYGDVISGTAQDLGMDIDELNQRFNIKAQSMSDEEAYEQYQNDSIATLKGRVEQNVYDGGLVRDNEYYANWAEEYNADEEDEIMFQSASSAGAGVNDIADAQREWEEKGTDSKYFKNWSNDAPVVSAENSKVYNFKTGEKVAVQSYHGTNQELETFDYNKRGITTNARSAKAGFWFVGDKVTADSYADYASMYQPISELQKEIDKAEKEQNWDKFDELTIKLEELDEELRNKSSNERGMKTYEVYVKFENPYVYDAKDSEFTDIQEEINDVITTAKENGHDGVIIKNLKDKPFEGGNYGQSTPETHYLAFDNTQIKSVDNRGTFDSNSGNIYYQTGVNEIDNSDKYQNLPQDLKDAIDYIYTGESVYNVTGKEFPNNGDNFNTLIGRITEYYKDNFNSKIDVDNFGQVLLDKKSVKNTSYHEFNTNKVNAFAAVPYVLQKGKIANYIENYKGKNEDRYLFVAPISIQENGKNEEYFCEVVVKATDRLSSSGVKRFYLHEVELKKKLADVFLTPLGRTSASSKSIIADLVNKYNHNSNNYVPHSEQKITSNGENVTKHEGKTINFQSMTKEQLLNVYMNQEFGMSADDITDMVTEDIKNILADYDVSEEEFKFEDIRIYGSYSKGTNKQGSDLDIVVQYSGSLKEDSAFNMFHDEELSIYDKKGNKVKIDINPINTAVHGTIDDYSKILFQSAYHGSPHRFDDFCTDHIGTGEGNQSHGWGLYFAGDKEVSERYRETLSYYRQQNYNRSLDDDYDNLLINGKPILENYDIDIDRTVYNHIHASTVQKAWLNSTKTFLQEKIDNWTELSKDKEYPFTDYAKDKIKAYTKLLNDINNGATIIDKAKGQLFEVDIPDSDVLLDEDKKFSEQPEKVQKALAKIASEKLFDMSDLSEEEKIKEASRIMSDWEGGGIYRRLSNEVKGDKNASKFLNKYGIKGITYDGRQDGRCYVIFDDKAVNVLKTYYQGEENNSTEENIKGSRGFTYQRETNASVVQNVIVLLNNKADKSTLLHEFAHVYLNVMTDLARTNSKARERLLTIDKWLRHEQGTEYTTAQHEKFARGFVAYVKQGKAPTYGLKKAFEHFKKWLNDLRDILEANYEADIDSEGIAVFDEILGGSFHEENLKNAEKMYQDAINYSQIKWAEEEDKKKQKAYFNQDTQLSDYQRRYRDTAYEIIFMALQGTQEGRELVKNMNQLRMILGTVRSKTHYKKSTKNIKNQADQIYEILANCGDVFSRNGKGKSFAYDEWGEFFKPLSDNYTDEDLATDAYDCIVQEDYLKRNDATDDPFADYYGDFYEGIVEESQYIFEYIVNEYKTAEDKTIPLLAWNEFHSRIHPYIIEDFEKKWENETAEIDRYQSLSKMQQAKEDLKIYAQVISGHGDFHLQFRDYAKKILQRLDFMTESDKEKVLSKIMEFNSFRDVENNLDDVMDYAETLQAVTERRILADDIRREVKQTIHEWKNGIKKTKYTYPANKLFERLRELNRMSDEDIENLYAGFEEYTLDYTSDDVNDEDYYKTIEKMFIQYRVNGRYYNSTAFLQDLLDKIQQAKFTAKVARDEIDFQRRMQALNFVDECKNALDERRKEVSEREIIKFMADMNAFGFNFNGALRMIFNDKIKGWASLDYLYAKRDGQVGKDRKEFLDKAKEVFGYVGKFADMQLQNKFIDMTKKEFSISQYHSPDIVLGNYRITENDKETGYNSTVKTEQLRQNNNTQWQPFTLELSRMELLYFYIQSKNPVSYKILTDADKGQFNQIEFDNLIDELTPQEKLLGDLMQMSAEKYWEQLNQYHIKKYHTELGKVKNYFPRLTEQQEVNMLEMFNDYTQFSGNGKFQKQRTAGAGTRIAPANALAVLFDHIEKANTVVIMGEHLDLINKVFRNPDLKRELTNLWGDKVAEEFYGQLAGNLFTGQSSLQSMTEKWYGKLVNNLIKTALFFKPQIGIKQLISFMNYGKGDEYVTAKEWAEAFVKQTFTPSQWKKNIDFMMSNEYLADRFSRGGSMDALKRQLDNAFFAKISLLDDMWSMPIRLGDIGAIILGGKPYIDVLMKKGYSKEDAFKIFIETTVNDQQSSIPSTLSNAQRNAAKQPFAKMFFAYQNTPWQYYRQCTSAVMNAVQSGKKKDIINAAKRVFLYGWLFPAIFAMASSLSPVAMVSGGDDDDFFSDINPIRTFTTLFTQMPIIGEVINGVLNAIEGKPFYSKSLLSTNVLRMTKLIKDVQKDGITLVDLWNAIAAFGELSTGQPLGSMGNAASGVYDITQGDVLKGTLKALGYSDHRASSVTGVKE